MEGCISQVKSRSEPYNPIILLKIDNFRFEPELPDFQHTYFVAVEEFESNNEVFGIVPNNYSPDDTVGRLNANFGSPTLMERVAWFAILKNEVESVVSSLRYGD